MEQNNYNILKSIIETSRVCPSEIAATDGTRDLTYTDILQLALHNAVLLRNNGVLENDFLLVSVDRTVGLPVAWLTSMFLGTVFVPIDRKWPAKRLSHIAKTTNSSFYIKLEQDSDINFIESFDLRLNFPTDIQKYSLPDTLPTNPNLYGFFTSGTTGTPKCALNHHAGVLNRLNYMTKYFGTGHVVLQNSSHVFDSSVWQILWPLLSRGKSVVPMERRPTDILRTVELIKDNKVTMTDFVPSIFNILVRELIKERVEKEDLSSIINLIVGGEQLNSAPVAQLQKVLPKINLINTYGHTEASIGMVFHKIPNPVGNIIPLGHPIDNTYVKICNENLVECAAGNIAEIVVGGICIGGGYLGLPEHTKSSFVNNPFPDIPGEYVYKTGDLGTINQEGLLEYHGRIDSEVKIRGVRINLSEIDHVCAKVMGGDFQSAAIIFETESGDKQIYVAYSGSIEVDYVSLTDRLSSILPNNHMPKKLLKVEELPLTQNGKADHKAIRKLFKKTKEYNLNSTLEIVLNAFNEFLPINVDSDMDFFSCGGDSLDAVNVSLLLEERIQKTINASYIYEFPKASQLAAFIESDSADIHINNINDKFPIYDGPEFKQHTDSSISHILLTGATGFVGIHIMERILCETEALVSIIVRGESVEDAVDRMYSSASDACIDLSRWEHRLRIIPGDLSMYQLGCSDLRWQWLTNEVDTIIHAGSEVNFLLTHQKMYDTNVGSTEQLIKLCSIGKSKSFHYISSYAAKVYDELQQDDDLENLSEEQLRGIKSNGYASTKLACERLLTGASKSGLNVTIYRLDDVLPSLTTGTTNKKSVIYRFFRICYRLQLAPLDIGGMVALSVDDTAATIIKQLKKHYIYKNKPEVVYITSRKVISISKLLNSMEEITSCKFKYVTYTSFLDFLSNSSDPSIRMLFSVLPKPTDINNIFGPSAPNRTNNWSGNYYALATAFAHYRFNFNKQDIIYGTISSSVC